MIFLGAVTPAGLMFTVNVYLKRIRTNHICVMIKHTKLLDNALSQIEIQHIIMEWYSLTLTSPGVDITCRKTSFKPRFTSNRTPRWQSNNIFPRLAGCCFRPSRPKSASSKSAGAYSILKFWLKKARSG